MSKIVLLKNLTSLQTPKESVEARPTTVQPATVSRMAGVRRMLNWRVRSAVQASSIETDEVRAATTRQT